MVTNVKQNRKLTGGQPNVASNITKSRDMGQTSQRIAERRLVLQAANQQFKSHSRAETTPPKLCAASSTCTGPARRGEGRVQEPHRREPGSDLQQGLWRRRQRHRRYRRPADRGSAWRGQGLAGYLDEFTKHRYNIRANMKWGDFLTDEGKRVRLKDLKQHHIVVAALRGARLADPDVQVSRWPPLGGVSFLATLWGGVMTAPRLNGGAGDRGSGDSYGLRGVER
jgi:hypothetical protein